MLDERCFTRSGDYAGQGGYVDTEPERFAFRVLRAPKIPVPFVSTDSHLIIRDWMEGKGISMWTFAELAERYRLRASRMSRTQYLAGKNAARKGYVVGIPVVILSAVAGSAAFASVAVDAAVGWRIVTGFVSIGAGVLAGLQTLFGFEARAERFRRAGAEYAGLKRELDILVAELTSPETEIGAGDEQLKEIAEKLGKLDISSPDAPDRFWKRARKEEKKDDEGV
jgi:hypothetical protein